MKRIALALLVTPFVLASLASTRLSPETHGRDSGHDTTLRDMARLKPTTLDALRHVYGVGERKAADLGERFLAEIRGD